MANHKNKCADDDIVLAALDFPKLTIDKKVQPLSEYDLINGVRLPPTGRYKFRCAKCNRYYDRDKIHNCKK